MAQMQDLFKRGRAGEWTRERIERLPAQDIKQLRANAERLGEAELAALCGELLKSTGRSKGAARSVAARGAKPRRLIARVKAFEARGVWLNDPNPGWGGVRKSDGGVVLALWADSVESANGTCSYLLWRPNVEGARPWSDTPAGKERLEHCRRALQNGCAEGLLVYGQALAGKLPEEKAYTVQGVDPEKVIVFTVEHRDGEYWAVWGKSTASTSSGRADWPRKK